MDQLVRALETAPNDAEIASLVLEELRRGHPAVSIRALLSSPARDVQVTGAWLLAELGAAASDLASDLDIVLSAPDEAVRVYGLDALMAISTSCSTRTIATGLELINDQSTVVRKYAIRAMAVIPTEDLRRAAAAIQSPDVRSAVRWLAALPTSGPDEVQVRLRDPNPVWRRTAAAAALKLATSSVAPLVEAARSQEEDINAFAQLELRVRNLGPD